MKYTERERERGGEGERGEREGESEPTLTLVSLYRLGSMVSNRSAMRDGLL